jgi:hypothetical protein
MKQLSMLGIIGGAALLIAAPFRFNGRKRMCLCRLTALRPPGERCRPQPKGSPKGISPRNLRNRSGCAGLSRIRSEMLFVLRSLRPSALSLQRWSGSIPPGIYLSTSRGQLLLTTFQFRIILQLPLAACGVHLPASMAAPVTEARRAFFEDAARSPCYRRARHSPRPSIGRTSGRRWRV